MTREKLTRALADERNELERLSGWDRERENACIKRIGSILKKLRILDEEAAL